MREQSISQGGESKFCTRVGAGLPEDEQASHDGAAGPASIWELEGEEEGEPADAHQRLSPCSRGACVKAASCG
jgi:hypothetical protein